MISRKARLSRALVVVIGTIDAIAVVSAIAIGADSTPATSHAATTCPTANFADLSKSAGAGTGYAKPAISVSCTATQLVVRSNGMPSYAFVKKTPKALAAQSYSWSVPLQPAVAAQPTSINSWMGTTGFTVSGLPIYGPMEGAQPADSAYGDPVFNNIVDTCKGHTGPNSEYHYHALSATAACGLGASPIVGYALDGFAIYGPRGCLDTACKQVVTFQSGYVKTGNPKTNAFAAYTYKASTDTSVLDACNGRVGPDGTYRYYATSTFPYTFACFKGTPTKQSGPATAPMPPMTTTTVKAPPTTIKAPPTTVKAPPTTVKKR